MSELLYYKCLSAALYLIIAVLFYRKLMLVAERDEKDKIDEIVSGHDIDSKAAAAIVKTAAMFTSLFWPISYIVSVIKNKGALK